MKNVYIKKDILTDNLLDHNALGTYISLRAMYQQDKPIRYISVNELCYELYGNTTYTRYTKEKVMDGLSQLITAGVVTKVDEISKTEFVLDLSNLHINSAKGTTDYYTVVTTDEIQTILNYTGRVDKFALLRYFIVVIGSISYITTIKDARGTYEDAHNFVGYMPQTYLAEASFISESSACTYMSILEELQLIYVYRHTDLKWNAETKQISSFVNKYGRFQNREMIEYFAKNYESFTNIDTINKMRKKKDVNYRRSLMQKYRYFYNGHEYDSKTLNEIYAYIHLKNQEVIQKIKQADTDEKRTYYESLLINEMIFKDKIELQGE